MMLIIGFGVTEVLLSTLVFTCETCGNHGAHQLTKQNRKFSLFFIPLFSVGTKYLDSCTACGGSSRSARCRRRQRPGRSARICGDHGSPRYAGLLKRCRAPKGRGTVDSCVQLMIRPVGRAHRAQC
jgi:hypothetical protein